MLDSHHWVVIASLVIICLQGAQLRLFKSKLGLYFILMTVPIFTWLISDFVSRQSITYFQQMITEQLQTLQIVVLLEAALLCFTRYKIPVLSTFLALLYGQLFWFQSGYFELSFTLQGIIYGVAIAAVLFVNKLISQDEPLWLNVLFITLLLTTYLTATELPSTSDIKVNVSEILVSIASFSGVIFLGFAIQKIIIRKFK